MDAPRKPKSVSSFPQSVARDLQVVFTDIDGTLTEGGKLLPEAFEALWMLHRAGIAVVPVTGRPAGWCDAMVRQWPVAGVVGENGAFATWETSEDEAEGETLEPRRLVTLVHPATGPDAAARLAEVREAILREVEGARVASDQPYRRFDLAIDFCEDPPDLGLEGARRIRDVFTRYGAHAKISNIHVNGWFGDYDKRSMVEVFCQRRFGWSLSTRLDACTYCGDSPNDEPMFALFPHAVGVANIADFTDELVHPPAYVCNERGGLGFCELADTILRLRAGR